MLCQVKMNENYSIRILVFVEQGTVPCFVMLCSMTNIKYTEQII